MNSDFDDNTFELLTYVGFYFEDKKIGKKHH